MPTTAAEMQTKVNEFVENMTVLDQFVAGPLDGVVAVPGVGNVKNLPTLARDAVLAENSAEASAARLSPFIVAPAADTALSGLAASPQWFTHARDGTPIVIPPFVTAKKFGIDTSGRAVFEFAGGATEGGALTIFAAHAPDGDAFVALGAAAGEQYRALYATNNSTGAATNEQIGVALVNTSLRVGGDYAVFPNYTYAVGGVKRTRTLPSVAFDRNVEALISAKLAAHRVPNERPFIETLPDDFLNGWIVDALVLGGRLGHAYGLKYVERFAGRFDVIVRDWTAGTDLQISIADDLIANTPKSMLFGIPPSTGAPVWNDTGLYLEFDWSKFVLTAPVTYTTYEQAGLKPSVICTHEEAANFIVISNVAKIIPVAPGNGTMQTAVDTILDVPHPSAEANFYYSGYASPRRVPLFELSRGDYGCRNVGLPPFCRMRGQGRDGMTRIVNTGVIPGAGNAAHILQLHESVWVEDVEFYTNSPEGAYAVHIERNKDANGPNKKGLPCFQRFDRCGFTAGPDAASAALGWGMGEQHTVFNNPVFRSYSTGADLTALRGAFASHNTLWARTPLLVEMNEPQFEDMVQKGVAGTFFIQTTGNGQRDKIIIRGGSAFLGVITGGYSADSVIPDLAEDFVLEVSISGSPNFPVLIRDGRGFVLGFPEAATVTESTPLLVKGLYSSNIGKAQISDIDPFLTNSIGKRLGINPTYSLTVAGVTWTASNVTDYTALSNATILASMNAVLGSGVVTIEQLDRYFYPDIGHKRVVTNNSGARMTRAQRGYAVRYTDTGGVRFADGDDPVDGWLLTAAANGDYVTIISAKRVASPYVAGATANGDFRIVAGVPTFAGVTVANRKGRVIDAAGKAAGVVELYP